MEHATQAGPFAIERYEEIRNNKNLPWQTWLDSRTAPSEARGANSADVTLVQSMLLVDAALRLAGAWEIVQDLANEGHFQLATEMLNLNSAIDQNGNVKPGVEPIVQTHLVLRAIRDSFMHGELSREQSKRRHKHRNALYASADYASAAIFEHCFQAATAILSIFHAEHRFTKSGSAN